MRKHRLAVVVAAFVVALYVSMYYLRNERVELKGVSRADAIGTCSSLDKFLARDASDVFVSGAVRAYTFFAKYRTTSDGFQQWATDRPLVSFSEAREFRQVYDVQSGAEEIQSITVPSGFVSECDLGGYHTLAVYDETTGICYIGVWELR
jgi:hypothetical protein